MGKNIVVISTSLRKGSNSNALAGEFERGAKEAGHSVEKVFLSGKRIDFCTGCLACQRIGRCVIQDDMNEILQKIQHADAVAFATPIYFYEMCGQMKTMLDRTNPLFVCENTFRDIYLLAAAADSEKSAMDNATNGLKGWIDCFDEARFAGVVCAAGVTDAGAVLSSSALAQAFVMGKRA